MAQQKMCLRVTKPDRPVKDKNMELETPQMREWRREDGRQ